MFSCFNDFFESSLKMNYFLNINFNYLLKNGVKFGFDLAKKSLTKVVSDKAFKLVRRVVLREGQKTTKKLRLKAGDSVAFVVTKTGLEFTDDKHIVAEEVCGQPKAITCLHPKAADQEICDQCLKSGLKSKL